MPAATTCFCITRDRMAVLYRYEDLDPTSTRWFFCWPDYAQKSPHARFELRGLGPSAVSASSRPPIVQQSEPCPCLGIGNDDARRGPSAKGARAHRTAERKPWCFSTAATASNNKYLFVTPSHVSTDKVAVHDEGLDNNKAKIPIDDVPPGLDLNDKKVAIARGRCGLAASSCLAL